MVDRQLMFLRFINGCLALIPVGAYWTFFSQKPQVLGLTGHNATNADALRACMNRGGPPALRRRSPSASSSATRGGIAY